MFSFLDQHIWCWPQAGGSSPFILIYFWQKWFTMKYEVRNQFIMNSMQKKRLSKLFILQLNTSENKPRTKEKKRFFFCTNLGILKWEMRLFRYECPSYPILSLLIHQTLLQCEYVILLSSSKRFIELFRRRWVEELIEKKNLLLLFVDNTFTHCCRVEKTLIKKNCIWQLSICFLCLHLFWSIVWYWERCKLYFYFICWRPHIVKL